MDIYNGDVLVGTLKYGRYTPYTEEPVPPEDEYKTVYTELRLSSVDIWNPYTAVSRYDQGESGIADVIYKDSAYMEAHPEENMASVPELETKGLLCFNRELEVYIALRFEPEYYQDYQKMEELDAQIDDKHNEIAHYTSEWEEKMMLLEEE